MDNRDGRFTPENAAGAYYPNVKKGRPIRVRTKWPLAGSYTEQFVGYVDEWPVAWPDGSTLVSTVSITATSRMARLGRGLELRSIVEEEILDDGPVLYFPLGEPSGPPRQATLRPTDRDSDRTQVGTGGTLRSVQGTGPGTDDLIAPQCSAGRRQQRPVSSHRTLASATTGDTGSIEAWFATTAPATKIVLRPPRSTSSTWRGGSGAPAAGWW